MFKNEDFDIVVYKYPAIWAIRFSRKNHLQGENKIDQKAIYKIVILFIYFCEIYKKISRFNKSDKYLFSVKESHTVTAKIYFNVVQH